MLDSRWNLEAIEYLALSSEPLAIPHLVPVVATGNRREASAGARAIKRLLSHTALEDLPALELAMRFAWPYGSESPLEPQALAKWVGPGTPDAVPLHLASMHRSGFVREEAVRRLCLLHDGTELPFLLLRLNDWVPEVRRVAHAGVIARLEPSSATGFANSLVLVARLETAQRSDHTELVEQIFELLLSAAARPSMLNAMSYGNRLSRRTSFRILRRLQGRDLDEMLASALDGADAVVRLWAARVAHQDGDRQSLAALAGRLSSDASAALRQEALRIRIEIFPEESRQAVVSSLLDRSASVRGISRDWLVARENFDCAAFYRAAVTMQSSRTLAAAISGLAETGRPDDAQAIESFLTHALPAVRRAAVGAVARLGGARFLAHIVDRVADSSPGVSNQACRSALPFASLLVAGQLRQRLSEAALGHVQKNLLRLMAGLPKWDSVAVLLNVVSTGDEALSSAARGHVASWDSRYNRRQLSPSRQQLLRLEVELAQAQARLPESLVTSIRFSARSFGIA